MTTPAKRIENVYDSALPNGGIVRAVWVDDKHVRLGAEIITRAELRERYSVRAGWTVVIADPAFKNV